VSNSNPACENQHQQHFSTATAMLKLTAVLLLAALARTSLAGDTDSDGVEDVKDLCPLSTRGSREHVDVNGCEHDQVDFDMDGWCNPGMPLINKKPFTTRADFCIGVDNCKFVKNAGQEQNYPADNSNDGDGDGAGDACNTGERRAECQCVGRACARALTCVAFVCAMQRAATRRVSSAATASHRSRPATASSRARRRSAAVATTTICGATVATATSRAATSGARSSETLLAQHCW
jgi:hypothetical protein